MSWLVLAVAAHAAPEIQVVVTVTDAAGQPVPDAVVAVPAEAQRHRVNHVDGTWRAVAIYERDGDEVLFAKGQVLPIVAAAPGFAPKSIEATLAKRSNPVAVALEPLGAPALACLPGELALEPANGDAVVAWAEGELGLDVERGADAAWCLLGARAYGSTLAWQHRSRAYVAQPTEEAQAADLRAQRRAYETALAWLEWSAGNGADAGPAAALCQVASAALEPCGPSAAP